MDSRHRQLTHLFVDHHAWLRERLSRRLGCRHEAADMAAETFAQIVARPCLAGIREPRALLTTIAKRLMYASWRRRDIERAYLDSLADQALQLAPSAEEQLLVTEALLQVDRLLAGLSSRARYAFLASQVEGRTYAQIAAELGVSAPRVHQYVKQGLLACYEAGA